MHHVSALSIQTLQNVWNKETMGCYFRINTLTWFRNLTVWMLRLYLRLAFSMHWNLIKVWMHTFQTLSVSNVGNNTYLPLETSRIFKHFWVSPDTPIPEFLNRSACRVRKAPFKYLCLSNNQYTFGDIGNSPPECKGVFQTIYGYTLIPNVKLLEKN